MTLDLEDEDVRDQNLRSHDWRWTPRGRAKWKCNKCSYQLRAGIRANYVPLCPNTYQDWGGHYEEVEATVEHDSQK